MISIPRSWARDLRAVFRRLNSSRNGPPLAVALSVQNNVFVAQCIAGDGAAEFCHASDQSDANAIVPLEALADCEGKDSAPVTVRARSDREVEIRWIQNSVPQVRTNGLPETKRTFPEAPKDWMTNPLALLDAIEEAVKSTADSGPRYALDHIQFKGSTGEVIASDSKQLLIQGGFTFPWQDDPLVSRIGAGAARAIGRVESAHIGRTGDFLWLRTGPWSLALPIAPAGRYPDVHSIVPSSMSATHLDLDPGDADTLVTVLPDLPGGEEPFSPVTVELNGQVTVRAKAAGPTPATELVLDRSQVLGAAVRFVIDRNHLSRVCKLGFDSLSVVSPNRPIVCRKGPRIFVAMPIDEKLAVPRSDDVLRVGARASETASHMESPTSARSDLDSSESIQSVHERQPDLIGNPIEEAAAIQADLRNVLGRVRGLSALIRRQRQKHRLTRSTRGSRKELQRVEA